MKRKKLIFLVIIILVLGVILFSLLKMFLKDSPLSNSITSNETVAETKKNMKSDNKTADFVAFYNCEVYGQSQEISTDGLLYKINSVSKSKDSENLLFDEDMMRSYWDENKNLKDEYWYYIVDISITKKEDSGPEKIGLNNIWLDSFDKNNKNTASHELQSFTGLNNRDAKDFCIIELEKGESFDGKLFYIVEESEINNDNFAILINNDGVAAPYVSENIMAVICDSLSERGE